VRELSHHVLDLLENSLAAGATVLTLRIDEDTREDLLVIEVQDNGRGMDTEMQKRAVDPFFTTRTTRHVGLGLPLLKAAAERCEGGLELASAVGEGTRVRAWFAREHIDRAPLGDMIGTLLGALLSSRSDWELVFEHRVDGETFGLDTRELRETLGDVPLSHPAVRQWLEEYLQQGYAELYATQRA
jgi:hypothetical protein